jgi:hypothetical protein
MAVPRNISKSRFCVGLQCLRRLWWEIHEPDAPELKPDERLQVIFDRGHRVGELARDRFQNGTLIDFEPWKVADRVQATSDALRGGARVVFEASFAAGGVFAALDVLEKRRRGWGLVEVKATLDVKEQFLPDVAVQLHAARSAGLDVHRAELMHLNRDCTYPALDDLFVREDVTQKAEALLPSIPHQLKKMRAALEGTLPDIEPGDQCSAPYQCPFVARCHPALPEHHVSTLYRLHPKRRAEFEEAGFVTLDELPADVHLSDVAARQVRSVKAGALIVEDGLSNALAAIVAPTAFLDFESVNPAVPVWDGCHPYQHVPVQMSCHVVGARGRVTHHDHLAEGAADPRPALAEAVVRACAGATTVVAYNSGFEARCLDVLAETVPNLRKQLRSIRERLVDLLPVVRDHVYHPEFGGTFGLKSVLPALIPNLGYRDLEIADGDTASAALEALLLAPADSIAPAQRKAMRVDPLAYCGRDTEALVALTERLRALAS